MTTDVKDKEVDDQGDALLVEPSELDKHLQDEAEPLKALTSCEAARRSQEIEQGWLSRKLNQSRSR